jgi:hypothetical protein
MGITEVITVFAIVATNLGTVIALYLNLDKKLDENRKETNDILKAIYQDIKDFHGRLCVTEERNKEKK